MKIYFNNCNTGGYPSDKYHLADMKLTLFRMVAHLAWLGVKRIHLNYFYDNLLINVVDR